MLCICFLSQASGSFGVLSVAFCSDPRIRCLPCSKSLEIRCHEKPCTCTPLESSIPSLAAGGQELAHRCGQPGSAIIRDKKRINPWPELFGSSALHFRLLWSAHCHCRTYLAPQVLDLIKHGQIGLRCDDELGPHAPGCLTCACRGFGLPWLWLFSQVGPETVRHRAFEAPSCHLTSSWQSVVMLHQAIRAVQDTMLHANLYLAPRIMNVLSSTSRAEPYLNAVARGRRPHPEIFRTSKLKTRIFNL